MVLKKPVEGGFFEVPGSINGPAIGDAGTGVPREKIRGIAGIRFGWIARQPAYARHGKTLTSCGMDAATYLTARRAFEPTIFPERLWKRTFGNPVLRAIVWRFAGAGSGAGYPNGARDEWGRRIGSLDERNPGNHEPKTTFESFVNVAVACQAIYCQRR